MLYQRTSILTPNASNNSQQCALAPLYHVSIMAPKTLNFITGNANKLREVQEILSVTPVRLQNQNIDLPELQGSIEEISRAKCRAAADEVC